MVEPIETTDATQEPEMVIGTSIYPKDEPTAEEEGSDQEELSSDEEEEGYSKMPTKEESSGKDQNLFKQITADIDPTLMARKQAEFDLLADGINRIFMGDIRNFYYDDFPSSQITSA